MMFLEGRKAYRPWALRPSKNDAKRKPRTCDELEEIRLFQITKKDYQAKAHAHFVEQEQKLKETLHVSG